MPTVSVITAAYNQAAYIIETIESVQRQTYRDFEHIIVDDGSQDNTGEILRSYGSRIRYVFQENRGNVDSRNRGCEIAHGQYIAILDGDDVWDERKLERQVAILDHNPEIGLVYTGCYEIDARGKRISQLLFHDISDDPIGHQLFSNYYAYSSVIVRKTLLPGNILLDPRFNLVGDRFLSLQIALQGKQIFGIPEGLLYLRTHDRSMRFTISFRHNYLSQMIEYIRAVAMDPRLPGAYKPLIKRAYARAYLSSAWVLIERGGKVYVRDAYRQLLKALRCDIRLWPKVSKQILKGLLVKFRR